MRRVGSRRLGISSFTVTLTTNHVRQLYTSPTMRVVAGLAGGNLLDVAIGVLPPGTAENVAG